MSGPNEPNDLPLRTLILGGARSGKSAFALRRGAEAARSLGARPIYVATARIEDRETAERVARLQAERGAGWTTIEEPVDLIETVTAFAQSPTVVVVDCLTGWLSNVTRDDEDSSRDLADALVAAVEGLAEQCDPHFRLVLVSDEVGLGPVPEDAGARRFRDRAGELHQGIAGVSESLILVVAGHPLTVK